MNENTGWLLDIYIDEQDDLVLWLLSDSGERLRLRMDFPVTFYVAGNFSELRQAWRFLESKKVERKRTRRRDLFSGEIDLLSVTVPNPAYASKVFWELSKTFPALDYYDADIPIPIRFIAQTGVHLLGHCRVCLDGETVSAIEPLNSCWELSPAPIPLRILQLSPDTDPVSQEPQKLCFQYERVKYSLSLEPARPLMIELKNIIARYDPDIILTDYGDTWLFPKLNEWDSAFNPNRDPNRKVLTRKASNYFAYGQVIYRGQQTHLFGRWHIDRRNALLFNEIGLQGILELARVSGVSVQDTARKSPGAGITAMQMLTALRTEILVPAVKQQSENRKTLKELIQADKGGLIYQPVIGLHTHVAQIDFASMYPSIMVNHNISPEQGHRDFGKQHTGDGLVPQTLRPLVQKRLALKNQLLKLEPRDCRVRELKERSTALKWLLVVCFGYLGYKNARFGKIESHEAVTAISRELMLQAKETAEDMDFTVLHMYVDSLFVQKKGFQTQKDFCTLLENIQAKTGIPITLEGIYKWLVFPASKQDSRIPVPNRYFGAFQDGNIKGRGISLRQHDTSRFVAETQLGILKILSQAEDPKQKIPEVKLYIQKQLFKLKAGKIPLNDLSLAKKVSRNLCEYKVPSPAAQAARQLKEQGVEIRAGMRVRFWYVHGGVKVKDITQKELDRKKYTHLLLRASNEILGAWVDPKYMESRYIQDSFL